jgi:hypothetical protein
LRSQGFDPTFVHRVSPDRIGSVEHPRVTDSLRIPSQVKPRSFDASPYVHDATVAMSHQAAEALANLASEHYVESFRRMFTKTEPQVIDEYRPLAEAMAKRDPRFTEGEWNARLRNKAYIQRDLADVFPGSRSASTTPSGTTYYPRSLDYAVRDMFHDGFRFSKAMDPLMNLFRMSVMSFSPSHVAHNVGGTLMLMAAEDPGVLPYMLSHWGEAKKLAASGELHQIPGMPPSGIGFDPAEMTDWLNKKGTFNKLAAIHGDMAGRTMARWMDEAAGYGSKVSGFAQRQATRSFNMVKTVDDFYRAVTYLRGQAKALGKDMTPEESQAAGVALVRKALPQWDRMTAFERNVVRSVFPFYSFSKFILRYAAHYPFDHPFRTAVMASLARNEANDFGNWLPQEFQRMFFLGHPDKNGNITAIDPGNLNPFRDIGNMFTIGGLTGKVNPVIGAALQQLGIDPGTGSQDLYPDMSIDPVTGTLKAKNPNFLESLVGNIVPQSQLVTALIGRNNNFAGMLKANPEAAMNYIRSSVGFPDFVRHVNVPQQAFKYEVARQTLQDQVKNDALKTGDWSRAMQFPGLVPFFQNLQQTLQQNPAAMKAYQSQVATTSAPSAIGTALVARNLPVG